MTTYKTEISKTEIPIFVELFEISFETEKLYLTSYITDIEISGITYKSAVMMREEFRNELYEKQEVTINIVISEDFASQIIGLDYPNYLIVIKRYFLDSQIMKTIFMGYISGVGIKERVMTIRATDILSSPFKKVPILVYSACCNRMIYDTGCGLRKAEYRVTTTVTEMAGGKYLVSSIFDDYPDGWFDYGFVEYDKWKRFISKHVSTTLELQIPFPISINGKEVKVYPGCDQSAKTCKEKFNNLMNFLGFPYMPAKNPVIWGL